MCKIQLSKKSSKQRIHDFFSCQTTAQQIVSNPAYLGISYPQKDKYDRKISPQRDYNTLSVGCH